MNLSDYIKNILEETKAKEITFDIKLNELGLVDNKGGCKIKFTLTRK